MTGGAGSVWSECDRLGAMHQPGDPAPLTCERCGMVYDPTTHEWSYERAACRDCGRIVSTVYGCMVCPGRIICRQCWRDEHNEGRH